MEQNWGESYIVPKNQKTTGKQLFNQALGGNVEAVSKGASNKGYSGGNLTGKSYAIAIDSEDTSVNLVGHDIKIAIQKGRQGKGWNQKQFAEALQVKPDVVKDYEAGKAIPDNSFIAKMERVLGVKLPRAAKVKKN